MKLLIIDLIDWRFIVTIHTRSILPHEKEQLTLLRVPAKEGNLIPVTVMEVGPGTHVCPKDLCEYFSTTLLLMFKETCTWTVNSFLEIPLSSSITFLK